MKEVLLFASAVAVGVSGWYLRGYAEKYDFNPSPFKKRGSQNGVAPTGGNQGEEHSVNLREAPAPSDRPNSVGYSVEKHEVGLPVQCLDDANLKPQDEGNRIEGKTATEYSAIETVEEPAAKPVGEEQYSSSATELGLVDEGRDWVEFEGTDYFYEERALPEAGNADLDEYARRLDELGELLVAHFSNQVETVRVDLLNEVKAWFAQHGPFDRNIAPVAEASARQAAEVIEVTALQENRQTFVEMYNQVMQDQYPRDEKGRFKARSNG